MPFFNKIFKTTKTTKFDLSNVATDVHSHLLPGIDDGSPNIETSINIIRELKTLGLKKLLLTPHVSADMFPNSSEIILQKLEELKVAVKEQDIDIELAASGEYFFDEQFIELYRNNQLLTFGQKYVLVELPHYTLPLNIYDVFFDMKTHGYKVIIAHPERYSYFYYSFKNFEKLKQQDLLFQCNIFSFSNYYSFYTRKIAERMMKNNMINFVGTDIHSIKQIEILKKGLKNKFLQQLIESNLLLNPSI